MPNGTYGGVRGEETKVGQKKNFRFPTYSIVPAGRNMKGVALDKVRLLFSESCERVNVRR